MRRVVLLPLLLFALLAAAPLVAADEAEDADESALVEEVLDEAFEECEEDLLCEEEVEAEEAEGEAAYPPECVLRSAKAHAVLKKNKLKLTVGYTTSEPTKANVDVHYGSTRLGQFKRHLRRSGVLRLTRPLKAKSSARRLPLRIELDVAGAACSARNLVLVPKG